MKSYVINLSGLVKFVDKYLSFDRIVGANYIRYASKIGHDWVPGGGSRRTVSEPEGSSTKASLSGAQENLVIIGSTSVSEIIIED